MLKTIYVWLMKSSEDPSKTSMTIKAGAATVITVLTVIFGLAHINVGTTDMNALVDGGIALVQAIAFVASSLTTVYALVRKIANTVRGTNQALNAQP